jgi:hypothetical protein
MMDKTATRRPEMSKAASTLKVLVAFVAGLVIAAGGFWLASRHSTTSVQNAPVVSARSPSLPLLDETAPKVAALTPPDPRNETAVENARAASIQATNPIPRPSTSGSDRKSLGPTSMGRRSAPEGAVVTSAKDLPDLKPAEMAPSAPQPLYPPAGINNGSGEVERQMPRAREPVFQPNDQPQQSERQPHTVTIDSGTSLVVRLGEALSTDKNVTGDSFRGTLDSPIVLDGFIIADKGSKVRGRVANSQKAGRVDGLSTLGLTLVEITTTDGQTVQVRTSNWEKQGEKSIGSDAAKIGAGAALGAIIGAIAGGGKGAAIGAAGGGAAGTGVVLATRGKPTVLPVETLITFRLDGPISITERINN